MIKNNVEIDIKVMCIEAGAPQAKLAQEIKTTPAYVNRVIRQKETVVNKTFTSMVEALCRSVKHRLHIAHQRAVKGRVEICEANTTRP